MGQAAEAWERLSGMLTVADVSGVSELYAVDALFLEPYNPPHRGNLLIEAYLKDWLAGKDDIAVETQRLIESADGREVAVEWTISYDAGGRRWSDLPRATFFAFDEDGRVTYHRDYT
ncbi:MAG: nuclear transport factor 2 family protein [Nitriliruptoraceae bacterium]